MSTKDQNVQMQLDMCRKHCEVQGFEIFEEYIDIAESGSKHSRPQFDLMLKDMRSFKFKAICVYKIDRIGRSMAHLVSLFEEFKNKKIEFVSVTQNINSTTPEGRMFMHMMMILAQYERELTVDRIKAGLVRAKKEGKKIGRPKTDVNKYEVVRLKRQGHSLRKIAEMLNTSLGKVQRCIKSMGPQDDEFIYKGN